MSASLFHLLQVTNLLPPQTIAALLLLNLPTPSSAFVALANILNRPQPLSFYAADAGAKSSAYNLLLQTLAQKSPELHQHIIDMPNHDPDFYLADLFASLFSSHLALDQVARRWDVYVFEGDAVLVRAGVALLLDKEMALLGTKDIVEIKSILDGSETGTEKKQHIMARQGEEDRWMQKVRSAGKI